jgi:hypothetical protein
MSGSVKEVREISPFRAGVRSRRVRDSKQPAASGSFNEYQVGFSPFRGGVNKQE